MNGMGERSGEVPEESVEAAERDEAVPVHAHDAVSAGDGTLLEHLAQVHGVDVGRHLSPATLEGLHDRVHGSAKASDD